MGSLVSFGDAYSMAKLLIQLGRAFTKGRKSAPNEFREVANQLYSLGAALESLELFKGKNHTCATAAAHTSLPATATDRLVGEDSIDSILQSCRECLEHLEGVVKQYSCINEQRNLQQPRIKRLAEDFKINWRKIAWTTEGGSLETPATF